MHLNHRNKARTILFFPVISLSVLVTHFILFRRLVNASYEIGFIYPQSFMINEGLFLSIIGHVLLILFGFVLFGIVRDKDFDNIKNFVLFYGFTFLCLILFSFVNIYLSYNYMM